MKIILLKDTMKVSKAKAFDCFIIQKLGLTAC